MAREIDYSDGRHGKKPRSRIGRICRAIYNSDKGEFFGRNCSSWAKIGSFYMIYYSCLAGFFAAMMYGFFQTLSETEPTQQGMYSLIKGNPGMGFRPQPDHDSSLIKFDVQKVDTYADKIADIIKYLKENKYIDERNQPYNVTVDSKGKPVFAFDAANDHCAIDYTNVNKSFGYAEGEPCILLKMNKVFGWQPQPFDNDSLTTTDHGKEATKYVGDILAKAKGTHIAVSCEGENDGDSDNMGEVKFIPEEGFSFDYFPYYNTPEYRAPLVWAKFKPTKPGTLLQIWCKVWAKNIYHHKNDKAGSVRFELLIDNKSKEGGN